MPHPRHPPQCDHPNNIWQAVQIIKLPTTHSLHSSVTLCHYDQISSSAPYSRTLFMSFR
jgi:hypothetical protein